MPFLTEQEWNRVLPLLGNIDSKRQQAAYNRLVLGMTLVDAGAPFGYSKQAVDGIVKAVLRWQEKLNGVSDKPKPPPGWVTVEFVVPRKKVDEVRRVVEAICPAPQVPSRQVARTTPSRKAGGGASVAPAPRQRGPKSA